MNIFAQIPLGQAILIYALSIWSLIWKGIALWKAVKDGQRNWFIVLLILNTVGVLEILYLFRFAKHRMTFLDISNWFTKYFPPVKKSK